VLDPDTAALLEVTRRHTRALAKQARTVGRLHAQLADRLDELAAHQTPTAQPKEAQRDEHEFEK
jgi:hypothetical protein